MSDLQKKLSVEKQRAELHLTYVRKLEELVQIESKLASISNAARQQPQRKTSSSKPGAAVSQKTKVAATGNKPVPMPNKPVSLPSLVQRIIVDSKRSLTPAEVAQIAIQNGYKTSAKDFSNNVYQALNRLVNKKSLRQNRRPDGRIEYSAA